MRSLVVGLVLAVSPAPAPTSIDNFLAQALDDTGLPGVSVAVTHGDRVVHATGAGHDSTGRPVTADTPMRVASVSKSFTSAAVMTLVEDGRLGLDDPVRLPNVPGGVTVRQLLNQTSGLADPSVNIGELESARTLAEYADLFDATLAAPPGTAWSYSNANYDLAARLVEVVSGLPFDEYVREAVFEPLDMRDSTVGGPAADGYNSLFGLWFSRPELDGGPEVNGSGAVVTTAADMGRWLVAQNGHGPFPGSMLTAMHEPSEVDEYGMGWSPGENGLLVHSGNLWTYNAMQAIDPATGHGYAVMTNGAGLTDETGDILAGLVALTRGEAPGTPGGSRQLFEWVLAAIGVAALTLGTLGVTRANRWATRRMKITTANTPTPTLSRGRPALPVYQVVGVNAMGQGSAVDNSVGCGQLRRWGWICLRLVPCLVPALLFVLYPQVVSFISAGRAVLWAQLFYFALPLTVVLGAAAVSGLAVFVARVVRLRSAS
ncbi:serine hydrolase domain-containing protein [Actinophytocola algeriensis]|uniref:CubicO group peptidase (Beta-lactamase class C family) n=1 Tax=Actinophytocola algeriensis TaxID=1768010 RepID=A0A7W7VJB4_9PSEU|nr:serine hydrolase domain-containing protein [Actinophytocola algeriensis]MBB4911895.1 CubicO group peptidase (beta-lactamase class C family) [Actinophytocola algeriensis]MBE1477613.1 CubicO group peptidase (beta-lactamase class C family) [Actinophytocola algeriensis]